MYLYDERLLVLAPHHDDAEFGMGAWLARMVQERQNCSARVVIAAGGDYTRRDGRPVWEFERQHETSEAMAVLGVTDFSSAQWFEENRGLEANYPELVRRISMEIGRYNPTDVAVCLPSFNQDHRALYDATMTALRPGQFPGIYNVWAYEYPGSHWQSPMPQFGKCYLGASKENIDLKVKALQCHRSQFEGSFTPVGPDGARILASQRGSEAGLDYAELVYLIREIHR